MKRLTLEVFTVLTMLAIVAGCAIERTQEQKVLSNIAVRNIVAQLIQRADNPAQRAELYAERLNQGESTLTSGMNDSALINLVSTVIGEKDLNQADQMLARDIMELIPLYFKVPEGKIPPSAYEIAQDFIKQARFAVNLYLPK